MVTAGIDEVGRGCWAGPLVAGAVVLAAPISGLTDSKLLSPKRRRELAKIIEAEAMAYSLGWVQAHEVDVVGLTEAVRLAMQRALGGLMDGTADGIIDGMAGGKTVTIDEIIIDGSYNFLADQSQARCLVKADLTVPAVSAASIIAKVARDNWMATQAARLFPAYGFDRHVGYGTAVHLQALKDHGITPLHRRSFKPVQAFC